MIDANILVENLRPEIWIHFNDILDSYCPQKNILHILKQANGFKAVMQNGLPVEVDEKSFTNLQEFWERFPEIDEIRIYTEEGLEEYDCKIQNAKIYNWDIDEYLEYQYEMLEQTEGIQVFRKGEKSQHIFQILRKWIKEDGVYLLWIMRKGTLYFNCILVVVEKKIKILTTSGRYENDWNDIEKVKADIRKEFPDLNCHVIMKDS